MIVAIYSCGPKADNIHWASSSTGQHSLSAGLAPIVPFLPRHQHSTSQAVLSVYFSLFAINSNSTGGDVCGLLSSSLGGTKDHVSPRQSLEKGLAVSHLSCPCFTAVHTAYPAALSSLTSHSQQFTVVSCGFTLIRGWLCLSASTLARPQRLPRRVLLESSLSSQFPDSFGPSFFPLSFPEVEMAHRARVKVGQ